MAAWASVAAGLGAAYLAADYVDSRLGISSDVVYLSKLRRIMAQVTAKQTGAYAFADTWEQSVRTFGDNKCVLYEDRVWTYKQVEAEACRVVNALLSVGVKSGDYVALMMENRPEFVFAMIAIGKMGCVTVMINTNLRGKSLQHCINIAGASTIVVGGELVEAVEEILPTLQADGRRLLVMGDACPKWATHLDPLAAAQPPTTRVPVAELRKGINFKTPYSLIYTSGTTGLPKAAVITQGRALGAGLVCSIFWDFTPNDICYIALPMFHSAAGMGTITAIVCGGSLVLKRKFSAKAVMKDIAHYNCTTFQYIGELCRYLIQTPPSPHDKKHKLRLAWGNGLRPDIWDEFVQRFNIPRIGEFYGATESPSTATFQGHSVYTGKPGKGSFFRAGAIFRNLVPFAVVKFDVDKDQIVRDANGRCIRCAPNEPGELIGKVTEATPFVGYHGNNDANNKKLLRDVFEQGDVYYRSGDIIKMDAQGFMYFVDRIGDTFRWKGENVSTNEVMEHLTAFPGGGVLEANVYGVEIPGKDGRAGMAAVVLRDDVNLAKLGKYVSQALPSYAVPIFLRLLPQIESTATFKYQKVTLRTEGCNPAVVKDPMVWFNPQTKAYEPFGQKEYQDLIAGKARL